MPSGSEVLFEGLPTQIDLLAADCQFAFLQDPDDFENDSQKVARFLSRCRGPALSWGARYLESNGGMINDSWGEFLLAVKAHFGYDARQSLAIARSQLSRLRHTGDVVRFFADFDDACGRADIHADEPRITMVLDKLKPRYREAVISRGVIPQSYPQLRTMLTNMGAMELQSTDIDFVQGKKGSRKDKRKERDSTSIKVKMEPKN